jgi:predicted nucleotidyltransferase
VDVAAIEEKLKSCFEEDSRGAIAVYLFGSVARGDAGPGSDVDVGVLFQTEPPATLDAPQFSIEADLERRLGRPVQVVALNSAPADLVHRVLRDGRIAYDCDRAARIRFEVQRRNEYFDLAPLRRLYRRYPKPASDRTDDIAHEPER